jgi:hypothetical protein
MAKRNYRDLFVISGKWLGVFFLNISKTKGLLRIFVYCGLILDKNRVLFAKWHGIISFELFSNGKRHGLGPWFVDHGRRWSTVDHRQGLGGGSP